MIGRGLAAAVMLACASPVHAELVFFDTGRVLSVKNHRLDGETMVLELRSGGQMLCEASIITGIAPDEVPYPEPAPVVPGESLPRQTTPPRLEANPRFDPIIERAAAKHGVSASLVRAVIQVESGYQPRARSRKGAMGLMQLMPSTARQYGVRNPWDPAANIEAGTRHLKSLLDRLPLNLALAAYNAGEAAVGRFGGIPPFPETQQYVSSVLGLVRN